MPTGTTIQWAPGLEFRGGIPNRSVLINVKSPPYNAKGDGVTDDTNAIQAALNAAKANQVVYLPASTYLPIAAGGSGSVYGYHYSTSNIESDSGTNWCAEDACTHGCEPYMTLFEGNIVGQVAFDDYHGGNAYNTVFRCWSLAWSSATANATGNREAIDLQTSTYYANIVACVLSYAPKPDTTDITYEGGTQSTAYVQGNFSLQSGTVSWISGQVKLPASLYYNATPTWWVTSLPFPAIGPDCSPVNGSIPAEVRYNAHT